MNRFLRKIRGALGLGVVWGVAWAALFALIVSIIGILDPASVDPGEGPAAASAIGATVGFFSGVGFGALLAAAEGRRRVLEIPVWRVALWGALGSAALPLLTPMNNTTLATVVPIGTLLATATFAIARRGLRGEASATGPLEAGPEARPIIAESAGDLRP